MEHLRLNFHIKSVKETNEIVPKTPVDQLEVKFVQSRKFKAENERGGEGEGKNLNDYGRVGGIAPA